MSGPSNLVHYRLCLKSEYQRLHSLIELYNDVSNIIIIIIIIIIISVRIVIFVQGSFSRARSGSKNS